MSQALIPDTRTLFRSYNDKTTILFKVCRVKLNDLKKEMWKILLKIKNCGNVLFEGYEKTLLRSLHDAHPALTRNSDENLHM